METPRKSRYNLRSRLISIMVIGNFNIIHPGHSRLFRDVKKSFRKVHLIVAIRHKEPSVLSLQEKVENLSQYKIIDEIRVLGNESLFDLLEVADYIVSSKAQQVEHTGQVLNFKKDRNYSSGKYITKVISKYDLAVNQLTDDGCDKDDLKSGKDFKCMKMNTQLKGFRVYLKKQTEEFQNELEGMLDITRSSLNKRVEKVMKSVEKYLAETYDNMTKRLHHSFTTLTI